MSHLKAHSKAVIQPQRYLTANPPPVSRTKGRNPTDSVCKNPGCPVFVPLFPPKLFFVALAFCRPQGDTSWKKHFRVNMQKGECMSNTRYHIYGWRLKTLTDGKGHVKGQR